MCSTTVLQPRPISKSYLTFNAVIKGSNVMNIYFTDEQKAQMFADCMNEALIFSSQAAQGGLARGEPLG